MPEKFYREDEVIVSVEDIDQHAFYVPAIVGDMLRVWEASRKPTKATTPEERLMMDIIEVLKILHDEERVFVQYDCLRQMVAKLKNCILRLHETGSLPDDCRTL